MYSHRLARKNLLQQYRKTLHYMARTLLDRWVRDEIVIGRKNNLS